MNQSFTHIATFRFVHEFMDPEVADLFTVQLSGDSRRLLSNLQLLIKPFNGGFHLLCSDLELLQDEQSLLMIRLFLKDPYFYNYTDLGGGGRPDLKVFHFSNADKSFLSGRLFSGDYVTIKDSLDLIGSAALAPDLESFEIDFLDPTESGDLNTIISSQKESVFFTKNQNDKRGYYFSGSLLEKKAFGIVSLVIGNLYNDFIENEDVLEFEINFKTLQSHWKYILSDPVYDKFSNLSVVDLKGNEIQFQIGDFEIQPNKIVRSFESRSLIPLKSINQARFQLIDKPSEPNQSEKVVIKALPSATPNQLFMTPSKPDIFFSHIFI